MSISRPKSVSLVDSANLLQGKLEELLKPDIRLGQARVLEVLESTGPTSQTVLAQKLGVTAGSMSTMIDRLEAEHFVSRRRDREDGRGYIIRITGRGEEVVTELRDAWKNVDKLVVDALGREKAALLAELTKELHSALGGKV